MIKNFLLFFSVFSFCILSISSCDGKSSASAEESPKGFSCQCEQSGALKPINASSIKEAETLCKKDSGKIKQCAKNQ